MGNYPFKEWSSELRCAETSWPVHPVCLAADVVRRCLSGRVLSSQRLSSRIRERAGKEEALLPPLHHTHMLRVTCPQRIVHVCVCVCACMRAFVRASTCLLGKYNPALVGVEQVALLV